MRDVSPRWSQRARFYLNFKRCVTFKHFPELSLSRSLSLPDGSAEGELLLRDGQILVRDRKEPTDRELLSA